MKSLFIATVALAALLGSSVLAQDPGKYTVNGMGGAGGMFQPWVSPFDSNRLFLACDMSGTYRSTDGGKSWRMYHYSQLSNSLYSRPWFTKDAIYWASGGVLKVSRDQGETWENVLSAPAPWKGGVALVVKTGDTLAVGANSGVYVSNDDGKTWETARQGEARDLTVVGETIYASVGMEVIASSDKGRSWQKLEVPAADDAPVLAIAGATDGQQSVLYATDSTAILQSKDNGKSWKQVSKIGCSRVLVPQNQTAVAWATPMNRKDILVSRDGGQTWENCFRLEVEPVNVEKSWVQSVIVWSYGILGFGINYADPNMALVSTQGDFYITRDGGKSWQQDMNQRVGVVPPDPGVRFKSIGLEVTSLWQYSFDPFDNERHYIAYTDIGFVRSVDRGQTWIYAAEGSPWRNTFYQIVFDPQTKGRIYAACSNKHDIPHYSNIAADSGANAKGGVCVSDDHGASWKVLGKGLPEKACTSILLDAKSSAPNLTFYVTLFGDGVYKSSDGGQTWQRKSEGLGNEGNKHVFMIQQHPQSGSLFCSITGSREGNNFRVPGGIWKSTDGGEKWTDISKELGLRWATGFALDPRDENVIYLAASTAPNYAQGGIYKTSDGGKTWKQLLSDKQIAGADGFSHCMFVTLHPDNPDWVYLSSGTHGLWLSKDAGQTWKHFDDFPFRSITRLTWDPKDHNRMYVTTFGGGVWKGPSEP